MTQLGLWLQAHPRLLISTGVCALLVNLGMFSGVIWQAWQTRPDWHDRLPWALLAVLLVGGTSSCLCLASGLAVFLSKKKDAARMDRTRTQVTHQ